MNTRKKEIVEAIQSLPKEVHNAIFQILKKNNVTYSQNGNGVFINMKTLPVEVLNDIDVFLRALKESRQKLDTIASEQDTAAANMPAFSDSVGFMLTESVTDQFHPGSASGGGDSAESMSNDDKSTVQSFCDNLRQEQAACKKSQNKFAAAKKRFARPCLTETKRLEENTWAGCFGLQKQEYIL